MKSKRQRIRRILTLIMFLLFPVIFFYFSPYISIVAPTFGIINGSLIVFASLFVLSLVFGRIFCGWMCPVGGLQEGIGDILKKRAKGGRLSRIKFIIWIPWLAVIIYNIISAGGFKTVDFLLGTENGISLLSTHAYIIYYIVLVTVVVLAIFTGRRGFCHYGCWIAPFMMIGTKIKQSIKYPSLHLNADKDKCIHCQLCTKNCPMSLDVHLMVEKGDMYNSECILCGKCVDTCPKSVIHYSFVYTKIK